MEDPRRRGWKIDLKAFSYPGREEPCDEMCGCGFLGNFYPARLQLAPPNFKSDRRDFENAEAAFQALKHWSRVHMFVQASGQGAFELKRRYQVEADLSYGGHGSNWRAMAAVLQAKFTPGSPLAGMLLETGDAFLLEHSSRPRDRIWSDNSDGEGANWLGLQLMLLRDSLRNQGGGSGSWTKYIEARVDVKTGAPRGVAWQEAVRGATRALARELAVGGHGRLPMHAGAALSARSHREAGGGFLSALEVEPSCSRSTTTPWAAGSNRRVVGRREDEVKARSAGKASDLASPWPGRPPMQAGAAVSPGSHREAGGGLLNTLEVGRTCSGSTTSLWAPGSKRRGAERREDEVKAQSVSKASDLASPSVGRKLHGQGQDLADLESGRLEEAERSNCPASGMGLSARGELCHQHEVAGRTCPNGRWLSGYAGFLLLWLCGQLWYYWDKDLPSWV